MAKSLIDKVIEKCGSQAEAARRLEVTRANVSLIASGKVQLSPELAALCAEIVGEDPYRCAAEAMVLNCKDRNKAERLNRAFHLPRLAGGAVMLLISLALGVSCPDSASAKSVREHLTVYTSWQVWCRIVRGLVLMARRAIGATGMPGTRTSCQAGGGHWGLSLSWR